MTLTLVSSLSFIGVNTENQGYYSHSYGFHLPTYQHQQFVPPMSSGIGYGYNAEKPPNKPLDIRLMPVFTSAPIFKTILPWAFKKMLYVRQVNETTYRRIDGTTEEVTRYKMEALTSLQGTELLPDTQLQMLLRNLATSEFIYMIIRSTTIGTVREDEMMRTITQRTPRLEKLDPFIVQQAVGNCPDDPRFSQSLISCLRAAEILATAPIISRSLTTLNIFFTSAGGVNSYESIYAFFIRRPTNTNAVSETWMSSTSSGISKTKSLLGYLVENLKGLRVLSIDGSTIVLDILLKYVAQRGEVQEYDDDNYIDDHHQQEETKEEEIKTTESFLSYLLEELAPMKGRLEKFHFLKSMRLTNGSALCPSKKWFHRLGELFSSSLTDLHLAGFSQEMILNEHINTHSLRLTEFADGAEKSTTFERNGESKLRTLDLSNLSFVIRERHSHHLSNSSVAKALPCDFEKPFSSPRCFKFVNTLHLTNARITDDCVKAIALNCVFLEHLHMAHAATYLSAKSIIYICVGVPDQSDADLHQFIEFGHDVVADDNDTNHRFPLLVDKITVSDEKRASVVAENLRTLVLSSSASVYRAFPPKFLGDGCLKLMSETLVRLSSLDLDYCHDVTQKGVMYLAALAATENNKKNEGGCLERLSLSVESVSDQVEVNRVLHPINVEWTEYFI